MHIGISFYNEKELKKFKFLSLGKNGSNGGISNNYDSNNINNQSTGNDDDSSSTKIITIIVIIVIMTSQLSTVSIQFQDYLATILVHIVILFYRQRI